MKFPDDCNTISERIEFLYCAENKLRQIHNVFAKWYREGIQEAVYNQLPETIKNRYPYTPQLSRENWRDFFDNLLNPRYEKVSQYIIGIRAQLKQSNHWQINFEDIDVD